MVQLIPRSKCAMVGSSLLTVRTVLTPTDCFQIHFDLQAQSAHMSLSLSVSSLTKLWWSVLLKASGHRAFKFHNFNYLYVLPEVILVFFYVQEKHSGVAQSVTSRHLFSSSREVVARLSVIWGGKKSANAFYLQKKIKNYIIELTKTK